MHMISFFLMTIPLYPHVEMAKVAVNGVIEYRNKLYLSKQDLITPMGLLVLAAQADSVYECNCTNSKLLSLLVLFKKCSIFTFDSVTISQRTSDALSRIENINSILYNNITIDKIAGYARMVQCVRLIIDNCNIDDNMIGYINLHKAKYIRLKLASPGKLPKGKVDVIFKHTEYVTIDANKCSESDMIYVIDRMPFVTSIYLSECDVTNGIVDTIAKSNSIKRIVLDNCIIKSTMDGIINSRIIKNITLIDTEIDEKMIASLRGSGKHVENK